MSIKITHHSNHGRVGKEDKRDFELDSLHIVAHGIVDKLTLSDAVIDELNKMTYKEAKQTIIKLFEEKYNV